MKHRKWNTRYLFIFYCIFFTLVVESTLLAIFIFPNNLNPEGITLNIVQSFFYSALSAIGVNKLCEIAWD